MQINLAPPSNWQDFESLCLALWKEIWVCPNAQKNGRQGQAQDGVDIWGKPIYQDNYSGVQCKLKKSSESIKLTEIKDECEKAKNFNPTLSQLTIATTSIRDIKTQKEVRNFDKKNEFPFSINIWSWDDINEEIQWRPEILKNFYPNTQFASSNNTDIPVIELNQYKAKDSFYAFFSRDVVKDNLSQEILKDVIMLIYEIVDNSFKYGKAKTIKISKLDKNSFEIKEDGEKFNPFTELEELQGIPTLKKNLGTKYMISFKEKYKDKITFDYSYEEKYNTMTFTILDTFFSTQENSFCEINVDLSKYFSRTNVMHSVEEIEIQPDVPEVVLNIMELTSFSAAGEFINMILRRIKENQHLLIYVPRNKADFFKSLITNDNVTVKDR